MKFFANLVVAVCAVGPEERKVPPKTPPQRLDTLCTMGRLYAESALNNDAYGIERNVTNILEAFDDRICPPLLAIYSKITDDGLRRCSFYDPNVEHGGPRPDENGMNRRDWDNFELCRLGDESQCWEGMPARSRRSANKIDQNDPFDLYWSQPEDERKALPELDENLAIALRQIRTGFQKWILRYISECSGQEMYGYHSARLKKVTDNIWSKMNNILFYQQGDNPLNMNDSRWDHDFYHHEGSVAKEDRPNKNKDSEENP